MFRFRMKSDTIQFWILVVAVLTLFGGVIAWGQNHFATTESVAAVSKRVDTEVEERRQQQQEMKAEMDGVYRLLVPPTQQIPIRHPGSVKGE